MDTSWFCVDDGPDESLLARALEEVAELALATADEGREDLDANALRPGEDRVRHLRRALALDRAAAVRAVRRPRPGEQEAKIVVDLRDRPDRGPGIVPGALLFDRNGGREPLDGVHVGLLHESQELPGVGGERLDVAALPLGVDRVERQRGLAGAGQPRDHGQAVARDRDVDVAEVVLAGAADDQGFFCHSRQKLAGGVNADKRPP
jgi:hypothetical protein